MMASPGQARVPLREGIPVRSTPNASARYRAYKSVLRKDFRSRCGYCDDPDTYVGGESGSHIDHFAPKSKFPHLENIYENLVYACPFCNRAKSDKWVGDDPTVPNDGINGFVDPCSPGLDNHLARNQRGVIIGLTPVGLYLVDNLNLRLARHQYIWQVGRIRALVRELLRLRNLLAPKSDRRNELLEEIADLFDEYLVHSDSLHE